MRNIITIGKSVLNEWKDNSGEHSRLDEVLEDYLATREMFTYGNDADVVSEERYVLLASARTPVLTEVVLGKKEYLDEILKRIVVENNSELKHITAVRTVVSRKSGSLGGVALMEPLVCAIFENTTKKIDYSIYVEFDDYVSEFLENWFGTEALDKYIKVKKINHFTMDRHHGHLSAAHDNVKALCERIGKG